MKKQCFLITFLICLLLPVLALAQSQTEWNRSCTKKTIASATLYLADGDDLRTAETVPAGAYIKQLANDEVCAAHGMARITWCNTSGATHTGYVYPSVIGAATVSYKLPSGRTVRIPEALLDDETELYKYLWNHYTTDMRGGTKANKDAIRAAAEAVNRSTVFSVDCRLSDGSYCPAVIGELGTQWCTVTVAGHERMIPTTDLRWSTSAPDDAVMATVYAPKSGKASMYNKPSTKGKVIKKAVAGKLVLVIIKGEQFSRVWYDGQIGYMQNKTLQFTGVNTDGVNSLLSLKGKTNGRAKVNVRQTPKANGRKVCAYPTGTEVTVLSVEGSWAEIDVRGYHGYVQTKFLTNVD